MMKYRNIMKAAAALTLVFAVGCGAKESASQEGNSTSSVVQVISADEAKKMMDEEEVIVVDVRTVEEFKEAHIEGAVLLPLDTVEKKAQEVLQDKEATYLIYCRSGNRSNQAAKLLVSMGYENIYDFGGIIDWNHGTVSGEN